jgi:D-alanyl-D-alanine carboxypeptidase
MVADDPEPGGDPLAGRMERLVEALPARRGIEHGIVAVESGDRSFRWAGAAGRATPGGEPATIATPFFIASIDKLLTATVVMQLVERGLGDLDASIATYLPGEWIAGLHRLDGVDRTKAITIRNLLGHTSGLADFIEDRPRGGRSLVELLVEEGDRSWEIPEALAWARDIGPHFPPQPVGTGRPRIRYCDTNYLLLIAIAQAVTGRRLHELYDEQVWRPLGLRHTYLHGFSEPAEPTPAPASLWFGATIPEMPNAFRSLFSVYSTVDDLIGFLRGFVAGRLFQDRATVQHMQAVWHRFGFPRDRATLRSPSWPIEYGLGIMRFRLPRPFTPFKPVPAVVGHSGSTGSWLFHCLDLDLYLAGTVDQGTAGAVPYRFVPRLLRELQGALGA